MLACPNCGFDNNPTARFCANCGAGLTVGTVGLGTGRLQPNSVLQGRYSIVRKVARGGMGAVYQATDTRLGNKLVAVKEMSDAAITGPLEKQQARQAFEQEARMLAKLNHPNLPRVTDHFSEGGKQYLVMDFIKGQMLQSILDQTPDLLDEKEVVDWGVQVCEVLEYLHSQQPPVIFRDLKPANIMLDRDGKVKLIDFGIARLFKPGKPTDTASLGTAGYAPPEQYGRRQTDARSDIYALGATLHHLLTNRDPAQAPFQFPPVCSLNPAVSPHVEAAIMKALADDRAHRFQTASEMKQALLDKMPSGLPSPQPAVPIAPPAPQPGLVQRITPFLLIAAVVLLFGAVLVMAGVFNRFLQSTPTPTPTGMPVSPPLITASNVARLTELAQIDQEVLDLAWSPDGQMLALATAEGIALYKTPAVTQTQFITTAMPLALAFSLDGRWLLTGDMDNVVQVWDISGGGVSLRFEGHMAPVTDVAFATNGQLVASSSEDDSVRVWDVAHEAEQYHLKGHSDWVLSIVFSPDGRWLASGSRDNSARLWNMKSGTAVSAFQGHTESVTSVAITPDSRLLASGSEDSTVRLWDVEKLAEVRVLAGHLAGVTSVIFNPDGRLLASGSRDGTVRLWDVETGVELRTLKGHTGEVLSVIFAPDGHWLASASSDGTVRLWGVR